MIPSDASSLLRIIMRRSFLIDPVVLGRLPALDLLRLEPESDLLLGTLDTVGAVADIATNIDGIVSSDGTRGRCERVRGAKDGWTGSADNQHGRDIRPTSAGLAGITAFPDHGNDWAAQHVWQMSASSRV
jgi:hypothetical protein